jgi:Carbohydrate-selective porin, OprB family/S-layer homology domain
MHRFPLLLISPISMIALSTASTIAATPNLPESPDPLAQITAVSQLSDVRPTDWAFQSLQSLIERYGCISGYPDKTYRGNRALTRYEFAAGLNACLDRVQELISAATTDRASKEDLAILEKLQTEFATELAAIRGRVDSLDTKTATLEKQQFTTTTKLQGQTTFALNGSNAPNTNATFLHRSRLSLTTSFSGKDLLLTQLQAGTPNADANSAAQSENQGFKDRIATIGESLIKTQVEQVFGPLSFLGVTLDDLGLGLKNLPTVDAVQEKALGTLATLSLESGIPLETSLALRQTLAQNLETSRSLNRFLQASSSLDYTRNVTANLSLNRLSYQLPLSPDLQIALFPQGYISDHIDTNRYANNQPQSFSTYGLVNNQLLLANDTPGAGAALHWHPGQKWLKLNLAYRAEQTALNSTASIFNNTNDRSGIFNDPNLAVFELELTPSKSSALRLQYSTGTQAGQSYRVLGTNLELALGKQIGIFGRFGYAADLPGDINAISWSTGLVISDLFKLGARAGISIGQPLIFKEDTLRLFNETQTNYEAFYHYPINNRIAISPAIQVIVAPGNTKEDTIVTGTLRTTFSF